MYNETCFYNPVNRDTLPETGIPIDRGFIFLL
jgi:hypothetical protein